MRGAGEKWLAGPIGVPGLFWSVFFMNPFLIAASLTQGDMGEEAAGGTGTRGRYALTQGPVLDRWVRGLVEDLQGRIMPCAGYTPADGI